MAQPSLAAVSFLAARTSHFYLHRTAARTSGSCLVFRARPQHRPGKHVAADCSYAPSSCMKRVTGSRPRPTCLTPPAKESMSRHQLRANPEATQRCACADALYRNLNNHQIEMERQEIEHWLLRKTIKEEKAVADAEIEEYRQRQWKAYSISNKEVA